MLRAPSVRSRSATTGRGHFLFLTYLITGLPRLCWAGFLPPGSCKENPAPGFVAAKKPAHFLAGFATRSLRAKRPLCSPQIKASRLGTTLKCQRQIVFLVSPPRWRLGAPAGRGFQLICLLSSNTRFASLGRPTSCYPSSARTPGGALTAKRYVLSCPSSLRG